MKNNQHQHNDGDPAHGIDYSAMREEIRSDARRSIQVSTESYRTDYIDKRNNGSSGIALNRNSNRP